MAEENYQEFRSQRLADVGGAKDSAPASPAPETEKAAVGQESPPEDTSTEQTKEARPETPEEKQSHRNKQTEKRFRDLTRNLRDKDTQIAKLQGQIEALMSRPGESQDSARAPQGRGRPSRDDFDDDVGYVKALVEWETEEARRETRSEMEQEYQRRSREESSQRIERDYADRVRTFRESHEDYDEVVGDSDIVVSDELRDGILSSDMGPAITYHLAQHPDEVDRLNDLNSMALGLALGRLEARLEDNGRSPTPPQRRPRRQSKPIDPLRSGSTDADTTPTGKESYRDFREKRLAGRVK